MKPAGMDATSATMADSSHEQAGHFRALIDDPRTDTVTVAVIDGFGRPMGKRITKDYYDRSTAGKPVLMSEAIFATDIRLDDIADILGDAADVTFQDFQAVVDIATACRLPCAPNEIFALCDSLQVTGTPLAYSPRQILRRQIEAAQDLGLQFRMASELEFYLLSAGEPIPPTGSGRRDQQASGQRQDYHLRESAAEEPLISDLISQLLAMGIPVEYRKGESGVGQHEIVLAHAETLAAADRHILFKYAVKRVAAMAGRTATFIAKLSDTEDGSSGHIHLSLWTTEGRPAGGASAREGELSETMLSFVAGVIAFVSELMPFCAPLPNSYKRYRPGVFAPHDLRWGLDDRHAAVRILGEKQSLRLEFRVPGADMNPYLAYSALIAAGLEGVRQGLRPPFRGGAGDAAILPSTLRDAVLAFEGSEFARACFGDDVVRYYATLFGREAELYTLAVTDWERARYYREA